MGYLTPDTVPDKVVCRALFIPDSEDCLAIVRGAIEELTEAYNWEKHGTLSPSQAADLFLPMFETFCLSPEKGCKMIGEIVLYAGSSSPYPEWLVCDGTQLAIGDYTDLYNVIGNVYGTAPTGYFKIPDLRGRTPSGVGTGDGLSPVTIGEAYGEETHILTTSEMPSHSHTMNPHYHGVIGAQAALINGGLEAPAASALPITTITGDGTSTMQSAGGGQAHNVIGPRLGLNYFIVAKMG